MGSGANTHLTHLEELVLTQGPEGYKMARAFLLELLETLKGNSRSHVQTSVKWDGAPAMVAGRGKDGKFFVGTKSVFNAGIPKINYTEEDIINNHSKAVRDDNGEFKRDADGNVADEEGNIGHGGLVDKLKRALVELPKLGIKNILQGDFMFDDSMLNVVEIDGEPHYRFKPNTIIYAAPVNSKLGQEIGQSKFGIVFHTTYNDIDLLGRPTNGSLGADVSDLNRVPGIWFDDAFFTDDTGTVTLTENEERRVISLVEKADMVNERINYNDLPLALLNIYINKEIKSGQFLEDFESSFEGFKDWYVSYENKKNEAALKKLTTEKGKIARQERVKIAIQQRLQLFENKKEDFLNLFRVSRLLFEAKNIFIEKYNNAVYSTKHFIDDGSGDLIATNPEGYVAVDHAGNGIKFVDRLEFSRANFMIDKSAKFTQESIKRLSKSLTINVSKDTKITKTLREWLDEMKGVGHVPGKVPFLVYNDLLNGALVVETVRQENAQEVIYNTVYEYTKNLLQEAVVLEFEDENEDPVIDSEFSKKPRTIALVAGAFKPPHQGHVQMVKKYATKADEVVVLISNPLKKQRSIKVGGKERNITAADSEKIWEILLSDLGLLKAGGGNVEVKTSPKASPVQAVFEEVGKSSTLPQGTHVILGASSKPDESGVPDWHRYLDLVQNKEKHVRPDLVIEDLELNTVEPHVKPDGTPYSASDFRDLLTFCSVSQDSVEYPDYAGLTIFSGCPRKTQEILKLLGITTINVDHGDVSIGIDISEPVEEMASASGGNGVGYGSPLFTSGKPNRRRKKKSRKPSMIRQENLDLSLVEEVLELIIGRGINYE